MDPIFTWAHCFWGFVYKKTDGNKSTKSWNGPKLKIWMKPPMLLNMTNQPTPPPHVPPPPGNKAFLRAYLPSRFPLLKGRFLNPYESEGDMLRKGLVD